MPPACAEPDYWPRVRLWAGRLAAWYLPIVYRLRPRLVAGRRLRLRRDWTVEVGDRLDECEVLALVIELCDHLERDHLGRRGDREGGLWTEAAACESVGAWEDLLGGEMGLLPGGRRARFPRGTPSPRRRGLPPNLTAEDYYDLLGDRADEAVALFGPYGPPSGSARLEEEPEPGRGLPGPGSGPGGGGDDDATAAAGEDGRRPGAAAAGIDLAGSEAPDQERLEPVVREVEAEMRRAAPGTLPAELERRVRRGGRPAVAWRQELARAVGLGLGRHDYSILPRPDYARLLATGAVGSRLQVGRPRVTVVRDTSASMDERLLGQALAEIEELTRHSGDVDVVDADTEIHELRPAAAAGLERAVGGGGTDMLGAAWEAWRRTRPDALVVLTDGQTPWGERSQEPPGTTWVVIARDQPYVPARFRSVIRVAA